MSKHELNWVAFFKHGKVGAEFTPVRSAEAKEAWSDLTVRMVSAFDPGNDLGWKDINENAAYLFFKLEPKIWMFVRVRQDSGDNPDPRTLIEAQGIVLDEDLLTSLGGHPFGIIRTNWFDRVNFEARMKGKSRIPIDIEEALADPPVYSDTEMEKCFTSSGTLTLKESSSQKYLYAKLTLMNYFIREAKQGRLLSFATWWKPVGFIPPEITLTIRGSKPPNLDEQVARAAASVRVLAQQLSQEGALPAQQEDIDRVKFLAEAVAKSVTTATRSFEDKETWGVAMRDAAGKADEVKHLLASLQIAKNQAGLTSPTLDDASFRVFNHLAEELLNAPHPRTSMLARQIPGPPPPSFVDATLKQKRPLVMGGMIAVIALIVLMIGAMVPQFWKHDNAKSPKNSPSPPKAPTISGSKPVPTVLGNEQSKENATTSSDTIQAKINDLEERISDQTFFVDDAQTKLETAKSNAQQLVDAEKLRKDCSRLFERLKNAQSDSDKMLQENWITDRFQNAGIVASQEELQDVSLAKQAIDRFFEQRAPRLKQDLANAQKNFDTASNQLKNLKIELEKVKLSE
jgi:hypothetical protein